MDYIRKLVSHNILPSTAEAIVQSHRDPPSHGIGLRSVAGRGNDAQAADSRAVETSATE
jgi:hypothetical protein